VIRKVILDHYDVNGNVGDFESREWSLGTCESLAATCTETNSVAMNLDSHLWARSFYEDLNLHPERIKITMATSTNPEAIVTSAYPAPVVQECQANHCARVRSDSAGARRLAACALVPVPLVVSAGEQALAPWPDAALAELTRVVDPE
jgi:hypothetical protein